MSYDRRLFRWAFPMMLKQVGGVFCGHGRRVYHGIVSSFDGVTVGGRLVAWMIQAERGRVPKVPKMSTDDGLMLISSSGGAWFLDAV